LDHFNILGGSIAQIIKNALKSNILAFLRRTSTADFSSALRIFAVLSVILPPQTLGWPSTARSAQELHEKVPSAQPLLPSER